MLLVVILAAIIHASWNLLSKKAANAGAAFVLAYVIASVIFYFPWVLWLVIGGKAHWGIKIFIFIFLSGILHLAYSLALQKGYQKADLSVVYPVARGTGPLLSSISAYLFLGEPANLQRVCGLLLVVSGIILIATDGKFASFKSRTAMSGVRWGLITGITIAAYTIADGYSVKNLAIEPIILDWAANFLRIFFLLPFIITTWPDAKERMKGHWGTAAAVGILSTFAYILVLGALKHGAPISLVAPARESSMMVAAIFGMVILREKVSILRITGCGLVILGVVLLGIS